MNTKQLTVLWFTAIAAAIALAPHAPVVSIIVIGATLTPEFESRWNETSAASGVVDRLVFDLGAPAEHRRHAGTFRYLNGLISMIVTAIAFSRNRSYLFT